MKSVTFRTEIETGTAIIIGTQLPDPNVYGVFLEIKDVGKWVSDYKDPTGSSIGEGTTKIVISGPAQDNYGNPVITTYSSFTFSIADLRRINWSDIWESQLFDFAKDSEVFPVTRRFWIEWCAKESNSSCHVCSQL